LGAVIEIERPNLEGCDSLIIFNAKSTQILELSEVPFEVEGCGAQNIGKTGFCGPL